MTNFKARHEPKRLVYIVARRWIVYHALHFKIHYHFFLNVTFVSAFISQNWRYVTRFSQMTIVKYSILFLFYREETARPKRTIKPTLKLIESQETPSPLTKSVKAQK